MCWSRLCLITGSGTFSSRTLKICIANSSNLRDSCRYVCCICRSKAPVGICSSVSGTFCSLYDLFNPLCRSVILLFSSKLFISVCLTFSLLYLIYISPLSFPPHHSLYLSLCFCLLIHFLLLLFVLNRNIYQTCTTIF